MQKDILLLPRVANPRILLSFFTGEVLYVVGNLAGLRLVLVVDDEDGELGGRGGGALLGREGSKVLVDILL